MSQQLSITCSPEEQVRQEINETREKACSPYHHPEKEHQNLILAELLANIGKEQEGILRGQAFGSMREGSV